ncbi:MAG: hypothetical protein IJB25_09215 [Clostridia bacterium]|nr:hypothetical protein [Clostridia bacterium]MBQ4620035.1 hypothetical protein [Clostridia bacterium]
MKKLVALMLILVFALSLAASAEMPLSHYTHPTKGYSHVYPTEWLTLDPESIGALLEGVSADNAYAHIDLNAYAEQIRTSDMSMFINPNGDNFNVVSLNIGMPYTAQQLVELLMPSLVEQMAAIMNGAEFMVEGDVCKFGDNEYAYVLYNWNGILGAQYCICESGTLYYITLTSNQVNDTWAYLEIQKMFEKVLASFEEK